MIWWEDKYGDGVGMESAVQLWDVLGDHSRWQDVKMVGWMC